MEIFFIWSFLILDSSDHPFLKMYDNHNKPKEDGDDNNNKPLTLKEREERDMAFFEKRFQERVSKFTNLVDFP